MAFDPHTRPPCKAEWDREAKQRLKVIMNAPKGTILSQGALVVLKCRTRGAQYDKPKPRGYIKEYSRQSRLRFLKWIAVVDWEKMPGAYFCTLTYPDEVAKQSIEKATQQRHHFFRWLESELAGGLPIIWRKEFVPRKSGEYEGSMVHHWHLVVFTEKHLMNRDVNKEWQRELGVLRHCQTDVKRMTDGRHGAFYVAKYMTKDEQPCILDNAAYLTRPGRAWGLHRKDLFQECPKQIRVGIDAERFDVLVNQINKTYDDPASEMNATYTYIGERASAARKIIYEFFA